ncbi:hypothetical protein APE01nite_09860 [Acetobacter peroxydans]|uniref:Uncharacterized protein n=1 Tax=Acetobacter peroxydans TaxID=104098 RepID=A0A4Y3TUK0_9PROT|nr:hypothetical protein AA13755_0351 [Acetobacter peroxydans NBRC 13755]GBR42859.1 hypothetical protein AA0475_1635 [Acetobacter peroxydans]GEB85189.1 hypothetical protein APE01nite_09860 [Acetobacter peroxydans]
MPDSAWAALVTTCAEAGLAASRPTVSAMADAENRLNFMIGILRLVKRIWNGHPTFDPEREGMMAFRLTL